MTLEPCPSSPNCISSQADPADEQHYMTPLAFTGDAERVLDAISASVRNAGGQVTETRKGGLDALFVSKLLRFKDDLRFEVDDGAKVVHFRSASRVGHSDLGANRKRMLQLTADITTQLG